MKVINFKHEKAITLIGTVLTLANLIKLDINEENLYKFAEAVEGKMNVSMSPWMLPDYPEKTSLQTSGPKIRGHYHDARVYKQGRLVRVKPAHKAWVNWIYDQPMSAEITKKEVINMENTWISNIDPELKAYFESLETEFPWPTPEEHCYVL